MRLNSPVLRVASLALAAGASVAASAVNVTFVSEGSYTVSSGTYVYTENVVYQSHPGLGNVSSFVETFVTSTNPTTDIGIYTGTSDTLTISIAPDFVTVTDPSNPFFVSYAGTWAYVSGTGTYANLTGGGTYTQNTNEQDQTSDATIKGALNPVPEPASIVALGLGAAAMLRRRKRA